MNPRSRIVLASFVAVTVFVLPGPASGGDAPQGFIGFTDGRTVIGVAGQVGDLATGALVIDGRPAQLECLEFVEGRERTHSVFARYRIADSDARVWIGIASHVQGSTQAMAGVARAPTSEDRCGAGLVPAPTPIIAACSSHNLLRP